MILLYKYCEDNDVTSASSFKMIPKKFQPLIKNKKLLPDILKFLHWRRTRRSNSITQIYADEEEQKDMEICHPHCIKLLKKFLSGMKNLQTKRALDVAGGDGRLAKNLLVKQFNKVDLFDRCPTAIGIVRKELKKDIAFGYAEIANMEDFKWEFPYSAVFMVWVSGYLNNAALISFLRKAKLHLSMNGQMKRRKDAPSSFVFLLDNVLEDGTTKDPEKGQRFRTSGEYEVVFNEAGLVVHAQSEPTRMPLDFLNIKVWALY